MNAQMNEEGVPLKCCTGCPEEDQWHPATTEFFYHHPSTKDKYTNKCKKCISHQRQERIIIEKPTNCACCGNPITQSNRGKIRQFCDNNKCKQIGRSFCRFCGKSISQSQGRSQRRQFCDNNQLCQKRYHRMGTLKPTWIEERNRTECIVCGDSITQPNKGIRKLCNKAICHTRYTYHKDNLKYLTDEWGIYGPEVQKVLREVQQQISEKAARRLVTAISHEYIRRDATSLYVPPDLLKDVLASAKEHNRSYQQEVLYLLEQALKAQEKP